MDAGFLVRLGWWEAGRPRGLRLELQPRLREGRLRLPEGSGGTEDSEVYRAGQVARYDAWSDNERPSRMSWSRWSDGAVERVVGLLGCVLCGDSLARVPAGAHTADGAAHVCSRCVGRIRTEAPAPRGWPLGHRRCGGCGRDHPDAALLFEGPAGKLCVPCAGALEPVRRGLW